MPREKIKFALRMSPETQQLVRVPFGDMGKKGPPTPIGGPLSVTRLGVRLNGGFDPLSQSVQ